MTNAGTWYPLPALSVGEGCEITIKSKGSNTGAVKVAHDDTTSKNAPFLLDNPGDSIALRIKSADQVVVSSSVAGQIVEVITEL